jgi:RNA polymerase sigma-70 factor (ECF subfamily)
METESHRPESEARAPTQFATTRWSTVLAAGDDASPRSGEALEHLCRAYWYPLYAFVRGQGQTPEDAQDLTQAFFERLMEKQYLKNVTREKGRFRCFLLMAFKRFLCDQYDRATAAKRGGVLGFARSFHPKPSICFRGP